MLVIVFLNISMRIDPRGPRVSMHTLTISVEMKILILAEALIGKHGIKVGLLASCHYFSLQFCALRFRNRGQRTRVGVMPYSHIDFNRDGLTTSIPGAIYQAEIWAKGNRSPIGLRVLTQGTG